MHIAYWVVAGLLAAFYLYAGGTGTPVSRDRDYDEDYGPRFRRREGDRDNDYDDRRPRRRPDDDEDDRRVRRRDDY